MSELSEIATPNMKQVSEEVAKTIVAGIAEGAPEETQEEVDARSQRYQKARRALLGLKEDEVEVMDEDWYRAHYPGFPDEFYPVFAKFSSQRFSSASKVNG